MMKTSDRILGAPRGTLQQAKTYAAKFRFPNGDQAVNDYLAEVFRLAPLVGIDPAIVVAQSVQETTDGGKPWNSHWWLTRLNPAGLGITGDPTENLQSHTWTNGTDSAQAHLAHLLTYALGPADAGSKWFQVTGESIAWVNVRYDAYLEAYGNTVQAETIKDLSGTWATDKLYAEGICARGNAVFPGIPDQTGGTMSYTTVIPGLPGGPLITDYPIRVDLLPTSQVRNRPGITAHHPRRSVQHGNGNPDSTAAGEAHYLHQGAPDGNGNPQQLSYHVTGDDKELWVLIPLDEVTWQAADGSGPGNMNGYSCEMVEDADLWANPSRRDRVIHICADFMGRCAARFGDVAKAEQHWDFNWGECCDSPCDVQCGNRHHCPDKLKSTGLWSSSYVPKWNVAKADETARMHGVTPPEYADPRKPPEWTGDDTTAYGETWLAFRRNVTALKDTKRLKVFDVKGPVVGPPIGKGTRFQVDWLVKSKKGNYLVTPYGTVVGAGNVTPAAIIRERA